MLPLIVLIFLSRMKKTVYLIDRDLKSSSTLKIHRNPHYSSIPVLSNASVILQTKVLLFVAFSVKMGLIFISPYNRK